MGYIDPLTGFNAVYEGSLYKTAILPQLRCEKALRLLSPGIVSLYARNSQGAQAVLDEKPTGAIHVGGGNREGYGWRGQIVHKLQAGNREVIFENGIRKVQSITKRLHVSAILFESHGSLSGVGKN